MVQTKPRDAKRIVGRATGSEPGARMTRPPPEVRRRVAPPVIRIQ
jgi:hypothetical protein